MAHFQVEFQAGWGDMDFNGHMRNTAYLDRSADSRMLYFQSQGFPMREFARLRIGPVVLKDAIQYFKEITLLEPFTVTLELAGMLPSGKRFVVRNTFVRADERQAAVVTSTVSWFDLAQRQIVAPPAPLLAALNRLERTSDFREDV